MSRFWCLFLLLTLASAAWSQTCDIYVNPTDGADLNPGTQFLPVRSFEAGFNATPNNGRICLAAGEYYLGSDADGIILSGPNKSVTVRLQAFGGKQEIVLSEEYLVVDVGTGTVQFERNGAETLILGKGRINSNSLSPANLNFLHTLSVRSGQLEFGLVPVSIESSVGNTLHIHSENNQKFSPISAGIILGGTLTGSNISYSNSPRTWKIEPNSVTTSRTIEIPNLASQSKLVFSNNDLVSFTNQIVIGLDSQLIIESSSTGSISVPQGIVLSPGSSLTHNGPQSLDLPLSFQGNGTSTVLLNGSGVQRLTNLTFLENASLDLRVLTGQALLPAGASLVGSLEIAGRVTLLGDVQLSALESANTLINVTGVLDFGGFDFSVIDPVPAQSLNGSPKIEIAPIASFTSGYFNLTGSYLVNGGGIFPFQSNSAYDLYLDNVTLPRALPIGTTANVFVLSDQVAFADAVSVSGGTLSILNNAAPMFNRLEVLSGVVSAGDNPLRVENAVQIEAGTLERIGFDFIGTNASISSTKTLRNMVAHGAFLTVQSDVTIEEDCIFTNGSTMLEAGFVFDCPSVELRGTNILQIKTGARISVTSITASEQAKIVGQAQSSIRVNSELQLGAGNHELEETVVEWNALSTTLIGLSGITFKAFQWATDGSRTSLEGDISLISPLDLSKSGVILANDAVFRVSSDLITHPDYFQFSPSSTVVFQGISAVSAVQNEQIKLPNVTLEGESLSLNSPALITSDLRINSGTITVPQDGSTQVLGSTQARNGYIIGNAGSTVRFGGSTSFTGVHLNLGANATLKLAAGLTAETSELNTSLSNLLFEGTGVLRTTESLSFNSIRIAGETTVATLELESPLYVGQSLFVDSNSELVLSSSPFIVGQALKQPSLQIDGIVSGPLDSKLTVVGAGGTWEGSGLINGLNLALDSPNSEFIYSGSGARLGESLEIESGLLQLGAALLRFEPVNAFSILTSIHDQEFAGQIVADSPAQVNPENKRINLNIGGTVTGFPSLNDWIRLGPMNDLSISAEDVLNAPPVFGLTASLPIELSGALFVESNTFLNAPSITANGQDAHHVVKGKIHALTLPGSGSLSGGRSGSASTLNLTGGTYTISEWASATSIMQTGGAVTWQGSTPLLVKESISWLNGSVNLQTNIIINRPQGVAAITVGPISVSLGKGSLIDVQSTATFTASPQSFWTLSNAETADGYIRFRKPTSFSGTSGIPRLSLSSSEAELTLLSDLNIGGSFESLFGTVQMDDHILHFFGSRWRHGGTRFVGNQGSTSAAVSVSGRADIYLDAPLLLEFASLRLSAGGQTISFIQPNASSTFTVSVPNRSFTAENGSISLGKTDIVVKGTGSPLIRLENVSILGDEEYSVPSSGQYVTAPALSFPFRDSGVGELVVSSLTGATLLSTGVTSIASIRIENDVFVDSNSDPVTISKRLVFGQSGARIVATKAGALSMSPMSTIVRRGRGALSHPITFAGPVNLAYDLDDGSITGQNRNFQIGELVAGFEVPTFAIGIKNLSVLAGNTGSNLNRVKINQDLSISGNATVWSGEVNWENNLVRFGTKSTLSLPEIDENARSILSSTSNYETQGPINVRLRPLSSSLIVTSSILPPTVTVDSLVIDIGDPGLASVPSAVLTGSRNARFIQISAKSGSSLNMTGNSLAASESISILSGRVFSDPLADLSTSGSFNLGSSGIVSGTIAVSVLRNATLLGQMQALSFNTSGNVNLTGVWQQSTSLLLNGADQSFTFNTPEILLANLTRNASSPFGKATITGPSNSQVHITGSLQLSVGTVVLNSTSIFLDEGASVSASVDSWVAGKISRGLSGGYTGSLEFPVGSHSKERKLDLIVINPLLTGSIFSVELVDKQPLIKTGFPLLVGNSSVLDTDLYYWKLASSVNFATSQTFSLSSRAASNSTDAVALLTRPVGSVNSTWKSDNLSSSTTLRSAILNQGLSPSGLFVTPGVTTRTSDFAFVQFVDGRFSSSTSPLDVYLDNELWLSNVQSGLTTPQIQIGTTSGGDSHSFSSVIAGQLPEQGNTVSTVFQLKPGFSTVLGLSKGSDNTNRRLASAPMPRNPSVLFFNAGNENSSLKIDHMFPSSVVLANGLKGNTMALSVFPTSLDQTIRIQSTDGTGVGHFKYQPISGSEGPYVMTIDGTAFSNFLVSPLGDKRFPVNATETENDNVVPGAFSLYASFPNPTIDYHVFRVTLPSSGTVVEEWIDPIGRRVLKHVYPVNAANTTFELRTETSSLSSGLYMVRIRFQGETGDTVIHKPVVVVR